MRISDWSSDVCSSDLCVLQNRNQLHIVKRLLEEVEGAKLDRFDCQRHIAVTRHHNDRRRHASSDHMFQQIHAIDARHPNIEKDAARCQSVHLFEKLGAAFKKHRLKPGHLQNETKALTNLIIIINHIYVTRHERSEEQTSELQSLMPNS